MPSRKRYPRFLVWWLVAALVLTSAGWWHAHQRLVQLEQEIGRLEADMAGANEARDRAAARAADSQRKLAAVGEAVAVEVKAIEGDQVYEDALSQWIARVKQLNGYLETRPDLGIPEFALLTENDWLDATKGVQLESEADFRKALAALRRSAREKSSPAIGLALKTAIAANNGIVPTDIQALAPYLPAEFDPSILRRFTLNPSGEIAGLVNVAGRTNFILVEQPVDELWDSMNFYAANGSMGLRTTQGALGGRVEKAIASFQQATGTPPTTASQLSQYLGEAPADLLIVDAYLKAFTSGPYPAGR